MGISSDLQRVIVARLKAAVPSVAGRVYSRRVRENAVMPYVRVGNSYGFDDSAECVNGENVTLQLDIFASSYPDDQAVKDTTDEVRRALKGWANTDVLTMSPLQVSLWRIEDDPDPAVLHGIVQVETAIED